jgi:hypothetical protein
VGHFFGSILVLAGNDISIDDPMVRKEVTATVCAFKDRSGIT